MITLFKIAILPASALGGFGMMIALKVSKYKRDKMGNSSTYADMIDQEIMDDYWGLVLPFKGE